MYTFALMAMLGLATFAVVTFADRYLNRVREIWSMLAIALGVGAAWLANFNLWSAWGMTIRASWIGVTLTGLAIGGVAHMWRELLGYLHGFGRKMNDEAEALEEAQGLRRVS